MPSPEEMGLPPEVIEFQAPDENTPEQKVADVPTEAAHEQVVEMSPENQATLKEIEGTLSIWKDNVDVKMNQENALTPMARRGIEFQRKAIPELEKLQAELRAGNSTTEVIELPNRIQKSIAERLKEIYKEYDNS